MSIFKHLIIIFEPESGENLSNWLESIALYMAEFDTGYCLDFNDFMFFDRNEFSLNFLLNIETSTKLRIIISEVMQKRGN